MKPKVAIVKCNKYEPVAVNEAVSQAVNLLGGMSSFIKSEQNVLIKPNLLSPHNIDDAVCAHPAVVDAVLNIVKPICAKCTIGDSPCISGESVKSYERLIKITGMADTAAKHSVEIVRFDDESCVPDISGVMNFNDIVLAKAVCDADAIINIPKFKTHDFMIFTGAVKNLYGCLYGRKKLEYHLKAGRSPEKFAGILLDILQIVKPSLNIMDGVVGMDGSGPSNGRVRDVGLIIASADALALDTVACAIADINPDKVPLLAVANELKLPSANIDEIEIVGESIDTVRLNDFLLPPAGDMVSRIPNFIYSMARNQFVKKPVFNRKKCIGCHLCKNACPAKVISGDGIKLAIDYNSCIRCYCCREVCPHGAINIKPGTLGKIIDAFSVD